MQDEEFARDVSRRAEEYYRQIARELGYQRYSEFWTWENRVKIYIYPDRPSFIEATGQPDWSQGMADYTNKELIGYAWSEGFIDGFLPHEMGHLIFRDYVGFKGEVPLWLDEGVAQWMELDKRREFKRVGKDLLSRDLLLPLDYMMWLDVREIKHDEPVVHHFYIQAVTLVGFLIEEYGSPRFINFCRQLRDGKELEEALRFSYPSSIRNLKEFEERWKKYIMEVE
jgi:hypothetical protein